MKTTTPQDANVLITIRPGPALHVWQGGKEVIAVPLEHDAALYIASRLLAEVMRHDPLERKGAA
jgi:hypothetical protein